MWFTSPKTCIIWPSQLRNNNNKADDGTAYGSRGIGFGRSVSACDQIEISGRNRNQISILKSGQIQPAWPDLTGF